MTKMNRCLQITGIIGLAIASLNVNAQNNLVAYWSFDSVNNKTFYDVTGNGYDAVKTGDSVGITDGLMGKALDCRGPATEGIFNAFEIKVNKSIGNFALSRFSIECWIYSYVDLVNPGSFYNVRSIFEYASVGMEGSGTTGGYMIGINDKGKLYFSLGKNSWSSIATDSTLFPHRWYHIVATYDSLAMKLYLNGNLVNQTVNTQGFSIPTIAAIIGAEYQYTSDTSHRIRRFFNGKIDELKLYNYALTSQTVAANYIARKPPEKQPFKITLGMNATYCKPGDTIVVPVLLTNFENFTMSALQYNFDIDPLMLKLLDVSKDSGLVKDWLLSWNSNLTDSIPVALAGLTKTLGYGQGELLRCKFLVNKNMSANDSTFIAINNVMVDEDSTHLIMVTTLQGKVQTQLPSIIYGDVNGNKKVDAGDAQEILAAVVGSITVPDQIKYPYFTKVVADVSGDGTISSYDAALVLQYCTGMISQFLVESKKPLAKKAALYSLAIQMPVADFSINYVSSGPGGMVYQITGNNLAGFVAGEFAIGYDPAVSGVLKSEIATTRRTASLSAKIDQIAENIKIAITVNDPVTSNDSVIVLATITLPPNATSSPTTAFQLKKVLINEGNIPSRITSAGIPAGTANNNARKNSTDNAVHYVNRHLLVRSNCQPVMVRIFTLQGKLLQPPVVLRGVPSTVSFRMDNYPTGVYIYKITIGNAAERTGNMVIDR